MNQKNKSLIIKFIIFLTLTYILIPTILSYFTKNIPQTAELNFYSFGAYTLIMVILFAVFNREQIINHSKTENTKNTIIFSSLTTLNFLIYYYLHFHLQTNNYYFPYIYLTSGIFYLAGILFIAIIFFGIQIFKQSYPSLLLFTLLTYFFYIVTKLLWQLWDILATGVSWLSYSLLHLIYPSIILELTNKDPILTLNTFQVIIGAPCSGIESISMFMGLFILLYVYEQKNLNPKRTAIIFTLGLILTYFLNVIRISLIMIVGTKYPTFALGMFHSQVGWILFSLLILILLYFGYGWMKEKNNTIKFIYH